MPRDFQGAFAALRKVLKRHARGMIVKADTPIEFSVITRGMCYNKLPLWFGSVLLKKSAVTYHLMPLYFHPALQAQVPAELQPRKQGKTCFNFQRPDPALFAQLDQLTASGRAHFERHGLLEPGIIPRERFDAALRAAGEDPEKIARTRKAKAKHAAAKRAATLQRKKAVTDGGTKRPKAKKIARPVAKTTRRPAIKGR